MQHDIHIRLENIEKKQNEIYHTIQAELAGISTQLEHIHEYLANNTAGLDDMRESFIKFNQAVDYIQDILDSIDEISFTKDTDVESNHTGE